VQGSQCARWRHFEDRATCARHAAIDTVAVAETSSVGCPEKFPSLA
jgi:hypothetical protein